MACSASERAGWRPLQAVQVLRHDLFTNDVLYLEVALDLRPLPAQLLPLLPLFCRWPPGLRPLVSVRRCSLARALGAVIDLLPAACCRCCSSLLYTGWGRSMGVITTLQCRPETEAVPVSWSSMCRSSIYCKHIHRARLAMQQCHWCTECLRCLCMGTSAGQ